MLLPILLTVGVFALCAVGLGIGLLVSQRSCLRGSCGGVAIQRDGNRESCGFCGRSGEDIRGCNEPAPAEQPA